MTIMLRVTCHPKSATQSTVENMMIIKRKFHTWHEEIETYVYGTSVLTVHAIAVD